MDKTLIIIFYVITFIIVISIFNKRDNLEEELSFLPGLKDSLIDYYETKPNENFIENNLQEFKKLEDKRHAMLLEQMKNLSRTSSKILEKQGKSTTTTIVSGTSSNVLTETTLNTAGQTFRQLITQQPHAFTKGTVSNFSTRLILAWSFDRILPKYENDVIAKLNFLNLDSSGNFGNTLPYIKNIKIQLLVGSNWENIPADLITPTAPSLTYSNTDGMIVDGNIENSESKTFTILRSGVGLPGGTEGDLSEDGYNLLNGTNSIKLRVYGVNNAPSGAPPSLDDTNVTQDDSRIILYTTNFELGQPSTDPEVKNVHTITTHSFIIVLEVDQTETGDDSSPAKIKEVDVEYEEFESLGYNITASETIYTDETIFTPEIASDTEFSVDLNSLKPGMKYIANFSTKNTLDAVSIMTTGTAPLTKGAANPTEVVITDPPQALILNTLNITTNEPLTNISSLSFSNTSLRYYATSSGAEIRFNNTSSQTFEITNPINRPSLVNNSFQGIGKNVDGTHNLCTLTQNVDDLLNGSINFHGFGLTTTTNGYIPIGNISHSDPHLDTTSEGFRLQGTFSLSNYDLSDISHSTNLRTFECSFERSTNYSSAGGNQTDSLDFVIDNLNDDPTISGSNVLMSTNEIIYTMGIPSVKSIDLTPEIRNYSNVNSINSFIKSDLKIGDFTYTGGNISSFVGINTSPMDLTLSSNSQINLSGSYSTSGEFNLTQKQISATATGRPLLEPTLNYRDRVYSLLQESGVQATNSLTFKIHCDRDSYNSNFVTNIPTNVFFPNTSNGTSLLLQLQTDPTNKIFELINHNDTPNEFAMLFYENTFSTNVLNYPDQLDSTFFTHTPFDYNDGTNGMILSLPTNSDAALSINQAVSGKYKMVLFKINDLESSDFGSDITDSLTGAVKAKSLENYLINIKHIPSNVVQECRTPYQNSFMLVYAKYNGIWAIGSPSITYKNFTNVWWNRRYIKATGDTSITEFYLDSDINGCKHYATNEVSIVYEVSGTRIDSNSPIYILVATKI